MSSFWNYICMFSISFQSQIYSALTNTIYSSTFDSINEWTINAEVVAVSDSTCPSGLGNSCMQVAGDGLASLAIPTTNYHSITISTEQGESISGGDWCYIEYTTDALGSVWKTAISMTNNDFQTPDIAVLPNNATINDQSSFKIRIRNTGTCSCDTCYYDNLKIEGILFTSTPTTQPTLLPTYHPTYNPTLLPTYNPTQLPTYIPTYIPTQNPTYNPITSTPTNNPSSSPTYSPTYKPTYSPILSGAADETSTTQNENESVQSADQKKMAIVVILSSILAGMILCIIILIIYKKCRKKREAQVAAGFIGTETPQNTNKIEMITTSGETDENTNKIEMITSSGDENTKGEMVVQDTNEDSAEDMYKMNVEETKGKVTRDKEDSSSAEDMFIQTQQTTKDEGP